MKKLLFLAMAVSLISCKKEELQDDSNDDSNATGSTIKLVVAWSPVATLHHCNFTYTDIYGQTFDSVSQMDGQVENVDFTKPFRVVASSGVTFYDPVNGNIYNDQMADYQLKKDGVVIDAQSTVTYLYEN